MRQLLLQNDGRWLRLRRGTSTMGIKCQQILLQCGFLFLSCLFFSTYASALPEKEDQASLIRYLTQEKTHLSLELSELQQSTLPKDEQQYNVKTQQFSFLLTTTTAKIQSLQGLLENQIKQQAIWNQKIKYWQQLPVTSAVTSIQERISKTENLVIINQKAMELTIKNLSLVKELENLLQEQIKKLQVWKQYDELEQKLIQIKANKVKLKQELVLLYQRDKPAVSSTSPVHLIEEEKELLINNQHIALIHYQLNILNVKKIIIQTERVLLASIDTKTLQMASETYKDGFKQYAIAENSLQQIMFSLKNEALFIKNSGFKKRILSLQKEFKVQIEKIEIEKKNLWSKLENVQNQLKKLLSSHQSLSEYNMNNLPIIFNKIVGIPKVFYQYLKNLALKTYDSYGWLDNLRVMVFWMLLTLSIGIFYILNRFLKAWTYDKERFRLTGYLYDGVLILVQRNIPYLCLFTMLWSVFYITNISFANYQLAFHLLTVWFTFKILILIARLVLLERISDESGQDVKLYYRLKWLLLFGGWATALMVFSHVLPLPLLLQDLFNRLFMLFILAVSLVTWKSKDVIPYLLSPILKHKKRYFKNAIFLLVVLVPMTLFSTAIIGLLGFVNLSWTMCRYQAYLLLVLVGYILGRGLLFDALELLSEWMISSLQNGWLWIEVFLKPIDKILRVSLLLGSILVLFALYGWHSDSLVIISLGKLAKYSMINITGIHITVASTIEFVVLLLMFIWASKWTREFCYRWLYKNTKDAGIRNSLSVFSQYAVVLLGAFVTLRVLGIDFSGMSMILGGLAVGMGFGLRDFASNIIGGIMLLIERPVREGDLITLGEYEGRVAHIGIRSMRVCSWDNMEVLIPNAETFNKPFTNWTHQDSIVRTVVPIKVSRADDPVMIQQLILDVLAIIPEIVPEPPAQVFLKKIDEALIEFEARYFINVQIHTRFEVRSKVLFAITAQFNAAGVRAPVEPIAVEFKEGHGDFFIKTQDAT